MNLLLVSRTRGRRKLLAQQLSCAGYACESVNDGDEALARIAVRPPSLAIADCSDADEEDLVFVALLRKRHPEVAVVAVYAGCARILFGKDERVVEFDGAIPPADLLRDAVAWTSTLQHLAAFKPRAAQA